MDEYEIEQALCEIHCIHESFDTDNPITYQILLAYCGDRLNDEQKEYIKSEMERLRQREQKIAQKWIERMGEMARQPLTETNKEAV